MISPRRLARATASFGRRAQPHKGLQGTHRTCPPSLAACSLLARRLSRSTRGIPTIRVANETSTAAAAAPTTGHRLPAPNVEIQGCCETSPYGRGGSVLRQRDRGGAGMGAPARIRLSVRGQKGSFAPYMLSVHLRGETCRSDVLLPRCTARSQTSARDAEHRHTVLWRYVDLFHGTDSVCGGVDLRLGSRVVDPTDNGCQIRRQRPVGSSANATDGPLPCSHLAKLPGGRVDLLSLLFIFPQSWFELPLD